MLKLNALQEENKAGRKTLKIHVKFDKYFGSIALVYRSTGLC